MERVAKHKAMLPNGRSSKATPRPENWHAQIRPLIDMANPVWRSLPKSATDMLIICIAKNSTAAAKGKKDKNGRPCFKFTFSEAEKTFLFSRPTFSEAIKRLIQTGYIVQVFSGGIHDGIGEAAEYQLSDGWKEYQLPQRSNENIKRARAAKVKIS